MRAVATLTLIILCGCTHTAVPSRETLPRTGGQAERRRVPDDVIKHLQDAWREFNKAVASFSVADGIDYSEAEFLAQEFFLWKISNCGFADKPEDAGAEWHARPRIGFSGKPGRDLIRINKETGMVSYASAQPVSAESIILHERERLREYLRIDVGEGAAAE